MWKAVITSHETGTPPSGEDRAEIANWVSITEMVKGIEAKLACNYHLLRAFSG